MTIVECPVQVRAVALFVLCTTLRLITCITVYEQNTLVTPHSPTPRPNYNWNSYKSNLAYNFRGRVGQKCFAVYYIVAEW
jgi:hypothetical protein